MTLRDYQQSAVDSVISWLKYKSKPAITSIATAGGKSHIIAALAEHYSQLGERVCILAHRKELLAQNGGKLAIPHGYCSASLGDKDLHLPVIVGGIQTIINREFAPFDVIIVDECHHMSNNDEIGRYWQFIKRNEGCKLIGVTATPYRTNGGLLDWGEIVYEASYPVLCKAKHVAPITNKVKHEPDLSAIKLIANDYKEDELSSVMESPELVDMAVKHVSAYGTERNSCMIFCVTVNHAKIIKNALWDNGINAGLVTGETTPSERELIIEQFRNRQLKYIITVAVLLEGFDAPCVDMILCLRPTKSKVLWEQMLGRGVRLYDGKQNCLLLDMAGNLREHGGLGTPFNQKSKRELKHEKGRICPACEEWVQPVTSEDCPACGYVFLKDEPHKVNHNHYADTESSTINEPQIIDVTDVTYAEHINRKKNTKSIKITYYGGYETVSEWIAPWSDSGWARNKAWQFFKERGYLITTTQDKDISFYSTEDLLFYCQYLKKPTQITVINDGKYKRIIGYRYEEPTQNTRGGNSTGISALDDDVIMF